MYHRLEGLLKFARENKRIVCYGAGGYGREILAFLRDHGIEIDAFVVSNAEGLSNDLLGIPVYELKDFQDLDDCGWILSLSQRHHHSVINNLAIIGVKKYYKIDEVFINDIRSAAIAKNTELKDIATKDRCFILGTGPSIKKQNLNLLCKENVFSCSWCSLLDQYEEIAPEYFVSPAFYNDNLGIRYIEESIKYLDNSLISDVVILDYFDKAYVQYYKAFLNKRVYYICQEGEWNVNRSQRYSLDQISPAIQTASIMLLKVAIYMGFKKIYLLGTEHDLVTKTFGHAYSSSSKQQFFPEYLANIVFPQIKNITKLKNREILRISLNIYEEYHYLRYIAEHNDIKIYNATDGGQLDEFERVSFKSLF